MWRAPDNHSWGKEGTGRNNTPSILSKLLFYIFVVPIMQFASCSAKSGMNLSNVCVAAKHPKNGQRLTSCSLLTQKSWMVLDTFLAMVMLSLVSTLDTWSSLQKTYSKDPVMNREGRTHAKWMDDKRWKKCMDDKMTDKMNGWQTTGKMNGWQTTDKRHWMTNDRQNTQQTKCMDDKQQTQCMDDKQQTQCMDDKQQTKWMDDKQQTKCMDDKQQSAWMTDKMHGWQTTDKMHGWQTTDKVHGWRTVTLMLPLLTEVYCSGENTPVWANAVPHIIKNHKLFKNIRHWRTFFDLNLKKSKQLLWGLVTCASGRWARLMASWANGD